MEPRLDLTTRGRVDHCISRFSILRSTAHHRNHSPFHHSLVLETRGERRDYFIENLGPSPATILQLELGRLLVSVEVGKMEQRYFCRAVSREGRECPIVNCKNVWLSMNVLWINRRLVGCGWKRKSGHCQGRRRDRPKRCRTSLWRTSRPSRWMYGQMKGS